MYRGKALLINEQIKEHVEENKNIIGEN